MLALAEVLRGEDPAYQGVEIKVLVTFGPATAFQEDEDDDDDMQVGTGRDLVNIDQMGFGTMTAIRAPRLTPPADDRSRSWRRPL